MPRETYVYRDGHGCVTREAAAVIDAELAKSRKAAQSKRGNIEFRRVERGTWLYRDGVLIPKSEALSIDEVKRRSKRSRLPAPEVAPPFPEHKNMRTGEMVSDRRRHSEILKQHNLVEIGNETSHGLTREQRFKKSKGNIGQDIKDAIEQVKAGKGVKSVEAVPVSLSNGISRTETEG